MSHSLTKKDQTTVMIFHGSEPLKHENVIMIDSAEIDEAASTPTDFKNVSQNMKGVTVDVLKLESVVDLMLENNVDAFLLQENWLIGSGVKVSNGITASCNSLRIKTSIRGEKGVEIML